MKHEGKRTLGRYRGIWADNIEMNVNEIDWACVDWIYERQTGHLTGCCEWGNKLSAFIQCENFLSS